MKKNDKRDFLIELVKAYYDQGDDYYAFITKKGNRWSFGYGNDYPLQHGAGESFTLPCEMIDKLHENWEKNNQ